MAKTARKSSKKTVAATNDDLQFNMTTTLHEAQREVAGPVPGVNLDELFGDLGESGEIIEPAHPTELEMAEAVSAAELDEGIAAVYAEQGASTVTAAGDTPSADSTAKPKKEKKAKAPKDPRLTYVIAKKSEIVTARTAGFELVLEAADAALSEEDRAAKVAAFVASIDALPKKVGEKAVQFFTDVQKYKGVDDIKNEVIRRAVQLLITEGELTSGDKGNLQQNLLSKPYSLGTARSQSNQMFALLPALKMTIREKGRMVPNPDSVLLMMLKGA